MSERIAPKTSQRTYIEDKNVMPALALEHISRYYWVGNWLRQQNAFQGRILDVGCGTGYGTDMLRQKGLTVVGLDKDPETVEDARRLYGGEFLVGNATRLAVSDEDYNAVVAFEIIEHIPLPNAMVSEAYRVLASGGIFIISTPNALGSTIQDLNPDHVTIYTPNQIWTMLRAEGFRQIQFFGLISDRPVVKRFYNSPFNHMFFRLKRKIGINKPLLRGRAKRALEWVVTGDTTTNLSPDEFRVVENECYTPVMIFIARKP